MLENLHLTQKEANYSSGRLGGGYASLLKQNRLVLLQKFKDLAGGLDKNLWLLLQEEILKISDKEFDVLASSIQRILLILSEHPELREEGIYSLKQILKNPQHNIEIMQLLEFFVNHPQLKPNITLYNELLQQLADGSLTLAQLKQSTFKDCVVNGLATSVDLVKPVFKLMNSERPDMLDIIPYVGSKNNPRPSDNLDSLLDSFTSEHATIGQLFQLLILMARLSVLIQKADGMSMRDYSELSNTIRALQLFYKEIQSNIKPDKSNIFELMQEDQKAGGKHNFDRFLKWFKDVDFMKDNQALFDQKLNNLVSDLNDKLSFAGFKAEQLLPAFPKDDKGRNIVPNPCTQTDPKKDDYVETKERKDWFSKADRLDDDAAKSLDTINASAKATYQSSSQITTTANDLMNSLVSTYGAMLQGR